NPGRQVVASHDGGVTWGPPHPLASVLPGGDLGTIDAAQGVLAAAYVDAAATPLEVVFETSTSDGASWSPHIVPLADGVGSGAFGGPPSPTSGSPMAFVTADPAHSGTYAVAVLNSSSTALDVYVTHDSGSHWDSDGPAVL